MIENGFLPILYSCQANGLERTCLLIPSIKLSSQFQQLKKNLLSLTE